MIPNFKIPSKNLLFALVDCNNFYVSCERVFNPKLIGQPVAILSNNDDCIVARSQEVKQLNIPMGEPVFQIKELLKRHGVFLCSSNYALYGDMSQRVMQTLRAFSPSLQIYSIDEAFLFLETVHAESQAHKLKDTVLRHTGIPVSIGVAPTKTLAKVANHVAKHDLTKVGVFLMDQPTVQESILRDLPVEKIWGIGHQLSQSLGRHGILTAWDLCCADDDWIRKNYSIVVLRTVWELRGLPCLELEEISALRKSIITSKSFGRAVMLWEELAEALSAYTARAAEKLRKQKSLASHLGVFIESKRQEGIRGYFNQTFLTLPQPTSFTPTLIHYAKPMLHKLFHTGLRYKKVGIILDGLVDEKSFQLDLFEENKVQREKQQMLMKLLDQTNRHFGKQVLRIAAEGIAQPWKMKQLNRSLRFTTRWDELLSIQI